MMSTYWEIQKARLRATRAASRRHVQLGTDQSQRIDIFGIIEQEGIWLMFQKLDIYGMYLRTPQNSGIILNVQHPLSLQRYTAAHEYGHHVLEHQVSVDTKEQIIYRRASEFGRLELHEVEAQFFAAFFLMPEALMNTVLKRLGLESITEPDPVEAYRLSLELGASYSATITHLVTLNRISRSWANYLLDQKPKFIKEEIAQASREEARSDVWPLTKGDHGKKLYLRIGDELIITLPETPSSGYIWTPADPEVLGKHATAPILLIETNYQPPSSDLHELGGRGWRRFKIRPQQIGSQHLRLVKRRLWLQGAPKDTYDLELHVARERQPGFIDSQLNLLVWGAT